jgi:tRNA (mo5U34)-methyltransferase
MRDYKNKEAALLKTALENSTLAEFSGELIALYGQGWRKILNHGDLPHWQGGFEALPDVTPSVTDYNRSVLKIGMADDTSMSQEEIETTLKQMHPWRKGPFEVFGVYIDTEWRSDWKWDRLKDVISPLEGRTILDIGCGSGYHLWRMFGADAKLAIGIDPTPLFSMHFATVKRYNPDAPAFVLPIGIEHMPSSMGCFDTVFSMGILYHRKSPIGHLFELKELLRKGGELVLDTLVIEGDETQCLMPHDRYGKMRNVWFIPSVDMLKLWLKRSGFKDINVVDVSPTTVDEQRSTDWMQFESLSDFLDPDDSARTIDGYPAPIRAILTAKK